MIQLKPKVNFRANIGSKFPQLSFCVAFNILEYYFDAKIYLHILTVFKCHQSIQILLVPMQSFENFHIHLINIRIFVPQTVSFKQFYFSLETNSTHLELTNWKLVQLLNRCHICSGHIAKMTQHEHCKREKLPIQKQLL